MVFDTILSGKRLALSTSLIVQV